MARLARKNLESLYIHVMVQGIEKKKIFNKAIYKRKYIELINKEKEEFSIELMAYCIMDNHAHMLLKIKDNNSMSKFMHKINFMFAQYYNYMEGDRKGYVFRDRFRSEAINNEKHLYTCIIYIHNNPVKANIVKSPIEYEYSSYKKYLDKFKKYKSDDIKFILESEEADEIFIGDNTNNKVILEKIIKKYEKEYNMDLKTIIKSKNKEIAKRILKEAKEKYKITYLEISKMLDLSLSTITRIINKK